MRTLLALLLTVLLTACGSDTDYAGDMHEQHDGETPEASGAGADAAALDVTREEVVYATVDGESVTGTLVRPAGVTGTLPAVIVIHEWWGLNDNVRDMAAKLAAEGYAALAVDLYQGESADTPDAAMGLMRGAADRSAALTDNLEQAYAYLKTVQQAPSVASLGWCFGGAWSLRAALAMPTELDAAVIYYGQPVTESDELAPLAMPILAHFGEADDSIPMSAVEQFDSALEAAGVDYDVFVYTDAAHAFANPSGQAYDPEAAETAWARTTAFLAANLKANGAD